MSQAVLFEGRASDTEVMCHNQFAPMTMQFGMTGAKTVIEGSHEHEGAARELGGRARTEQNGALTALTALARGRRHYAGQRLMRASTPLVSAEPQVSILHGTLLWPGKQVNSCQAVRAVGAFSRNPYKDAWSRLDHWEYGLKKFGPLWKHLVDEYLVNTTPSLGSWLIRPGGQAIFVKLTPAALQACPAAMRSLQKIGITMENYLERYHARVTYSGGYRYRAAGAGLEVHESHVLRSRDVFVWCQKCGAYCSIAGPSIHLLKRECQVATQEGRANLKRIRQGLPPDRLASKLAKRLGTLSPGHALAPSPA